MIVRQLWCLIITVTVLLLFVDAELMTRAASTSCNNSSDIHGPYLENQPINSVVMVTATESDPAIIVCRYVCHDRVYQRYNYQLIIDILDPCAPPESLPRESIPAIQEYHNSVHDFRVIPIANSFQTCNQTNSETIRKYQIHVGNSNVPTLIAKCFVMYSPNSPSLANSTGCYSSSTLAIVPGYLSPDSSMCIVPSKTILPSSPTRLSLPSMSTIILTEVVTSTESISTSNTLESTPRLTYDINVGKLSGNSTSDCYNLHKIYGSILAVTVFTAVIVILILLAMIILFKLKCTQKLKIRIIDDAQLYTCKKTEDKFEVKEAKDVGRTATVAWENKINNKQYQ